MILFLIVLGLCASTWRATRLLVKDDLPPIRAPREWLVLRSQREDGTLRWYGELITCPWCVSVWVAAAFTLATDLLVGLPVPVLTFGLAAAFAATYEDLTTRGSAPQVDVQRIVMDALENSAWQQYALKKLRARADSVGSEEMQVHLPTRTG